MDVNNNFERSHCDDDPGNMLFDTNEHNSHNNNDNSNDGDDEDEEEVPTHLLASSHHSNLSYIIGDIDEDSFHRPPSISCPTPTGSNKNILIDKNDNNRSNISMEEYKNSIYNRLESFEEQLQNELQCLEEAYYDYDVEINDTDDTGADEYDDYSTRPIVGRRYRKKKRGGGGGQSSSSYKHKQQQQKRYSDHDISSSISLSRGQRRLLSGKRLLKLSHKTNEILTNYQTYLDEIQTFDDNNVEEEEEDVVVETADYKNHTTTFNHHHPAAGNGVYNIEQQFNDNLVSQQQLHREWNYYNNKNNNTNIAAGIVAQEDDEYDEYDIGINSNRGGHNKIVKRGITIIVAIGIICIGIGIMASGMMNNNNDNKINADNNKSSNIPIGSGDNHHHVTIGKEKETVQGGGDGVLDQKKTIFLLDDEEEDDVEDEEESGDDILEFGATTTAVHDASDSADTLGSTGGATSSSSTYHTSDIDNVTASTTTASGMLNNDATDSSIDNVAAHEKGTSFMSKVVNDVYYNSIKRYQPTMYNRSKGWLGQTYMDALVFCSKEGLAVCPYDAICPNGAHGEPLGGYRDGSLGDWEWLPIVDDYNEWVQGSAREKCVKYSHKYAGEKPVWGVKSDDDGNDRSSSITENIMCCVNVM